MPALTAITLFTNGLMLTIALGSLLVFVVLLQNSRRALNNTFGIFIAAMVIWSSGSLISRATVQITVDENLTRAGLWLLEIGFGVACISIYVLAGVLTESRNKIFWFTVLVGVITLLVYQLLLFLLEIPIRYSTNAQSLLTYSFPRVKGIVYFAFSLGTLFIVWQNQPKIQQRSMTLGLSVLAVGQIAALVSPRLRSLAIAEDAATMATLVIIYAIIRAQVVDPLSGRERQVKVVRDVGSAITNVQVENVLQKIAAQATELLGVAGSAIYLRDRQTLVLKGVHQLPDKFVDTTRLNLGEGVAGTAAAKKQGILINHYRREWKGKPDMPLAFETFGAVLCVPLMFGEDVVGVLLVVERQDGRLFDQEDMSLLELLAPQAAVAITNNRLFIQERALTTALATAKTQLETVLISTMNPVIAVDHHLRVIFANPAAVMLISPDNPDLYLTNCQLLEFIQPDLLPKNPRAIVQSLRRNQSFAYEVSANKHEYLCHVTRLTRPNRGWVAVLNDITTLKEIDHLKSQMVRMTSHDLKNPLFAIMNYMELLQEDGEGRFTEGMQRNANAIWTQLERMQRLINGILDLERVESGVTISEMCDVRQTIATAVHGLEDLAIRNNLTLHTEVGDDLPAVAGDPQQLGQAIANLLDNAIKFTPSGGSIWVRANAQSDTILLSVEDTGIGIPYEAQALVFERFFRVKSGRLRDDIGSGLGLSLVKAIVEHHKGQIWLQSEENKGSTFYVTLPAVKEPAIHPI